MGCVIIEFQFVVNEDWLTCDKREGDGSLSGGWLEARASYFSTSDPASTGKVFDAVEGVERRYKQKYAAQTMARAMP